MTTVKEGAPFALLDDCHSTASARSSRLYTRYAHERTCTDPAQLDAVCAAVQADLASGLHALVLGDYAFGRNLERGVAGAEPLRFLLFGELAMLSRDEADAWLAAADNGAAEPSAAGVARLRKSVTRAEFDAAIDAIHTALRAGDSYQVNYTYRLGFDAYGSPLALYRRLRARQAVRYGALVALPDARWIVSCSPELFVEKAGERLRTRPMKGTAPRSADRDADARAAAFLASDAKNRAENVMIVDLLRNDVSRVAVTGSVRVPALFTIEPYASVWQMTSTVEAEARPDAGFADMLRALFPCGSITGAPKHATMALIDTIESTPRGLYTGALGWLDAAPAGSACGDFCLSVTIRTLTLDAPRADGCRPGAMGVGAGIVLDSVAADEYVECELKARFLTDADPGFQLFETMQATRADGVRHLDRHLARLGASAEALGFEFDATAVRARIDAHAAALDGDGPYRVRAALSKDGVLALTGAALAPLAAPAVTVLLASEHGFAPMHSADWLLAHKTTRRAEYDRAWREAEAAGAFDMLFVNERGELTEGGRSNLFVRLDGRWVTPPLASGLLPGVMRAALLDDAGFGASERVLTPDDLARADGLLICNALRGPVAATLRRG
ncbi:aminodeoxychorismate synthase component I [Burkholderia sp. Ac-20379]|uniref:aminodeoxychorismate synthase component I n=1 Tax=Burkholderia sp. Ac-20379 TaxID=2703900 RepID=UPI00197D8E2B|nr:aminodeoxychorismate synthase component I [Burkholderia sp. Ac-20379]MBN3726338.1 aminodeoxychorismate synthase component I [Burkholderia sp. Ac-20379]